MKNEIKLRLRKACCVTCLLACGLAIGVLGGCGSQESEVDAAAEEEQQAVEAVEEEETVEAVAEEESAAFDVEIGEDSQDAASILITNKLGVGIDDIAFIAAGSEDEPSFLMGDDGSWGADEVALVHYQKPEEGANVDIHVKAGDTSYTLHDLDLTDVEELSICLEGDIAYATFERDGDAVSSLDSETELAEQQAAAEAEAQAAEEEEPAAEEYYEEEPYYEEPYYEEPYYEEPYYEQPSQGEQGCVEGGVALL